MRLTPVRLSCQLVILDGTDDFYPDPKDFRGEILRLKEKYPNTITTPKGFLR